MLTGLSATLSSNATGWWYNASIPDWTSDKIYEITAKAKIKRQTGELIIHSNIQKRYRSADGNHRSPTLMIYTETHYRLLPAILPTPVATSKIKEVHYAVRNLTLGTTGGLARVGYHNQIHTGLHSHQRRFSIFRRHECNLVNRCRLISQAVIIINYWHEERMCWQCNRRC